MYCQILFFTLKAFISIAYLNDDIICLKNKSLVTCKSMF